MTSKPELDTPMELDRKALKEAALKATPGPWYQSGSPWFQTGGFVLAGSPDPHAGTVLADLTDTWEEQRSDDGLDADHERDPDDDAAFIALANPATILSLLASLEESEGREKARVDKVEKIGCRAAELTFDWLCGEFEDLPNKLAEDMSVKITDSIIWALGEGSVIDDFADAEQQVRELTARAEASEQRERRLREAGKPFFDLAKTVTTPSPGTPPWWQESQDWTVVFSFAGCSVTLGDLRRAALSEEEA